MATAYASEATSFRIFHRSSLWLAARGLLALALGVLAIAFPASALLAFTLVFALFALLDGLVSLFAGVAGARRHGLGWGVLILRGAAGIAAGLVFVLVPVLATISYAMISILLVSAWAVVTGLLEIAAAVRLRRSIEGEWALGLVGLLSVALGVAIVACLFLFPATTLLSVAWMIGAYALAAGVVLLVQAARLRTAH